MKAPDELGGLDLDAEWRQHAACRGLDPNFFFPARGEGTLEARTACQGCPVRVECAEDGWSQHFGIWGGLSERQRRRQRRQGLNPRSSVEAISPLEGETLVDVYDYYGDRNG